MTEQWKAILDWPDYDVSDHGQVRSHKYGKIRILKQNSNSDGYPQVRLYTNGKHKTRSVHCLVAEAFLGPQPEGHEVNHRDGLKHRNVPSNLEWVTHLENIAHAERLGLANRARGEQHGRAKITVAQVIEMRRLHALGKTRSELGKRFGVTPQNVGHVVNFVTWRHVAQKG